MKKLPWELVPEFKPEILTEMTIFIADIRDEVIELHDENLGDSRLSLGMRAYECCRKRIIRADNQKQFPWLSILTPEGRFTFAIKNIPVRFTRNDPKYLPDKKLVVSDETQEQFDMFHETMPYATLRWFFVFDTHYKAAADAVYFVGYNEVGQIVSQWQVPVEENVVLLTDVNGSNPAPEDIEPPTLLIKKKNKNDKDVKSDE